MIAAGLLAAALTVTAGAEIQFSSTNKGIDIVYGEYTGFSFAGPESPLSDEINTGDIATVKFYIKCPDLEQIDTAIVLLAYNSGTTSWVQQEHDLNDGLIVEVDVSGVVEGDFFEAALTTWNEAVWGSFSVDRI